MAERKRKYRQGLFRPMNPKKYRGDPNKIIYRSGWELKLMQRLDMAPEVEWWASEEVAIPYLCPVRKETHRYFVDFLVKYKNGRQVMIEIKPYAQTKAPPPPKRLTKRAVEERATYMINEAKWAAARQVCERSGWEFQILTERELFGVSV